MYKRRTRDELTYKEIAREFGVSQSVVTTAVKQMNYYLDEYENKGCVRVKCRGKLV
jgi:predicted DNA-binding protein YlxM (UPF0122 family)